MVASPDDLLDDLAATRKDLLRVQEEGGSAQEAAVLQDLITHLSFELEEMEFQEEALGVLKRKSVPATCEGVI